MFFFCSSYLYGASIGSQNGEKEEEEEEKVGKKNHTHCSMRVIYYMPLRLAEVACGMVWSGSKPRVMCECASLCRLWISLNTYYDGNGSMTTN